MERQERDQKIIELVKQGYEIKEIAPLFNITFQRVSQICYDNGLCINDFRVIEREKLKEKRRLQKKEEQKLLKKIQFFEKFSDIDPNLEPKVHRESKILNDTKDPKVLRNRKGSREYYKRNYYKVLARRAALAALRFGYITPTPCLVCGAEEVELHHYNGYTRPLDVHFYCKKHHMELHRGDKREVKSKRAYHKRRKPSLETREKLRQAWLRRKAKLNEN